MEDYFVLVILGLIVCWGIIAWFFQTLAEAKKYRELKPRLDTVLSMEVELRNEKILNTEEYERQQEIVERAKTEARAEVELIAKQKSMGFPWLAAAYADYFALRDQKRAHYLEKKKHPALTAAATVKEIRVEKRNIEKEKRILAYKINYYEKLFPWLTELLAENESDEVLVKMVEENEIGDGPEDRVRNFLTSEEYQKLPSVERNQLALDRYLKSRQKSKHAIGRDYEMYVGYRFEKDGYTVEYKGIVDGFDDLGRDIIARKNDEVLIVQCKYWAQYKDIHEKHIFQLFGTTMEYWIRHLAKDSNNSFSYFAKILTQNKLRPIFFTSTTLSGTAKEMAESLCIEIRESEPIGEFPRIKCNIGNGEYLEKIYHLPIDQQYDRTIIGNRSGEFMAYTVKEAEDAGFRRAFRHNY